MAEIAPTGPGPVQLMPINMTDAALVDTLLDRLTSCSLAVDEVPRMQDGARDLLTATPPGWPAAAKHVFAVVAHGEPVGLVDLIDGYPRPGVAFIGLLAIAEDRRRRGLGRAAYEAIEAHARDRLGASTMRLAVVDTNPVRPFWCRMGFHETGEVRPYPGAARSGQAHLMEKQI